MSRASLRLLLPAACVAAAAGAAALVAFPPRIVADDAGTTDSNWPWGAAGGSSARMGRRDLYNLGILGAKARDADRAPPAEAGSGKHQVKMEADPSADRGPNRLLVEVLDPSGPAAKAGLKTGDIVTGVNGKAFKDGSIAPLAKAILDAESGATKGVTLSVERLGAKPATPLVVAVPVAGKDAATPTKGKARAAQVNAALAWLAKRQDEDGGFAETLSGKNGSVVQTCMAGLAWLAGGSDLAQGPYAANVRRAVAYVKANAGVDGELAPAGGANWSQTNWGVAHAAIFLGELYARSPDPEIASELKRLGDDLAKRQEGSGGWAHGPGGPNALGYVELNIVSGLSLLGMGLARQAGWEPPDAVLAKARTYIEDSASGDGGVGYSTNAGQKGQGNIGRSAAAWMGYSALGLRREKWTGTMAGYIHQHAGDVFGGHASLMQHFFLAGLAAQALGGEASKNYWAVAEANLVLARTPDGSFQPRPWHESLALASNSDVSFGDVWTTAAWAIVLAESGAKDGLPGLPALTGRLAAKPRGK